MNKAESIIMDLPRQEQTKEIENKNQYGSEQTNYVIWERIVDSHKHKGAYP